MPLQIAHETNGTYVVLVVTGDLDLVSAMALVGAANELIDAGAHDVVIDARPLTFCDSSGLGGFVRVANRLRPTNGRLAIAGPSPIVRRVLDVTGLSEAFIVTETVPEAIAQLAASPSQ